MRHRQSLGFHCERAAHHRRRRQNYACDLEPRRLPQQIRNALAGGCDGLIPQHHGVRAAEHRLLQRGPELRPRLVHPELAGGGLLQRRAGPRQHLPQRRVPEPRQVHVHAGGGGGAAAPRRVRRPYPLPKALHPRARQGVRRLARQCQCHYQRPGLGVGYGKVHNQLLRQTRFLDMGTDPTAHGQDGGGVFASERLAGDLLQALRPIRVRDVRVASHLRPGHRLHLLRKIPKHERAHGVHLAHHLAASHGYEHGAHVGGRRVRQGTRLGEEPASQQQPCVLLHLRTGYGLPRLRLKRSKQLLLRDAFVLGCRVQACAVGVPEHIVLGRLLLPEIHQHSQALIV
mmetsp:Transcript_30486/g.58694  ORF Transcript_30486/g.58694 Transcript_30486/m.58694 type:complete len:343 (-) Transcript_30486:581-1609(-)